MLLQMALFHSFLWLSMKLQYFGHLMWRADSLEKTDAGRDWGQEENGMREDEMAGWHHRLDGRESEWTLEVGDGQGGLACCDSLGRKESDTTELLTWTELNDDYEFGWVISNGWYYPPEDKLLSPTWHQSIRSLLTMFPFWIHFFFSLPHEDRHSVFIS